MADKTYYIDYDPAVAHEFISRSKRAYKLNINACVKSGALMVITDLPLDEKAVRALVKEVQ